MEEELKKITPRRDKLKLNKNHIQGFIVGVLIMALLTSAALLTYNHFHQNGEELEGVLQGVQSGEDLEGVLQGGENVGIIYRSFPSSIPDLDSDNDIYVVSELLLMPAGYTPKGYVECVGNIELPISRYPHLYCCIGSAYGGDSKTYFALPKLEGQIPLKGFRYYLSNVPTRYAWYPNFSRDSETGALKSHIDGNIKYFEYPIDKISIKDIMISQIVLAANIDEEKYAGILIPCDGRTINHHDNNMLGALLNNRFGGDGNNSFKLPDFSNITPPVDGAKYYIAAQGLVYTRESLYP